MKTGVEQDNLQVLTNLLAEAREEADLLRTKVKRYENILLSTKLLMGHELKKPTTAITGYLDLALESLNERCGDERTEPLDCLKKARKECDLLSELNSIFLALLRINGDQEQLPVQKVRIEALFKEVIEAFHPRLGAGDRVKVRISPEAECIHFNGNALKVIVTNIVENALLYSSREHDVFVNVDTVADKRTMRGRELVRMTVKDGGEGIPEEFLQKIFNPFVRLHKERAEGSGLGLTLVRSLVELYGGEVSVDSGRGRGTTIFVTIPVMQEDRDAMVQ
ncbi:MAG: HAMP domain-containing histidine kinase [Chitinivibrionia bacterium]|nr:HAMP domain-containing histidine kinase [Chitinivibrionia bacterium]